MRELWWHRRHSGRVDDRRPSSNAHAPSRAPISCAKKMGDDMTHMSSVVELSGVRSAASDLRDFSSLSPRHRRRERRARPQDRGGETGSDSLFLRMRVLLRVPSTAMHRRSTRGRLVIHASLRLKSTALSRSNRMKQMASPAAIVSRVPHSRRAFVPTRVNSCEVGV